jgi:ectoine hydroxylase-related dioxygenase (phytanoyl-CoA dioxygenase family)
MRDLDKYAEQGFLFPLEGLAASEAAQLMERVADLEESRPGWLFARVTKKPHLLLTWLNRLIRDPRILDPVERILGPNLLCWGASFFAKLPRDPGLVTWHQDSTYWGLSKPDVVTAWVAFTPSTVENGCMRVIPGSHTADQLPHRDTFGPNNLLTRGQEVAVEVDESKAVDVVLAPGQFSLHHVRLVHGSEPNTSDGPRIGFAIRYLPTYVRQVSGNPDSATLVRGRDEFGHFELEPAPESDFHPGAVAFHARVMEAYGKILYGSK